MYKKKSKTKQQQKKHCCTSVVARERVLLWGVIRIAPINPLCAKFLTRNYTVVCLPIVITIAKCVNHFFFRSIFFILFISPRFYTK